MGDDGRVDPSVGAIDAEVLTLTETLARHAHDAWVRMRTEAGWRHGPVRDERLREHPCLVAYEDLPDSEKEYDRQMTLAILRTLQALGYVIRKR